MSKTLAALVLTAAFGSVSPAYAGEQIPGGAATLAEGLPIHSGYDDHFLASTDEQTPWDDTVEKRRHFDEHLLQAGVSLGSGSQIQLIGLFAEANVWDRLALGAGAGVSFWGPEASGYVRFRPVVWGGEGRHLLNALTLRAEYTVMREGAELFSFCDDNCGVRFVDRTAQLGALSVGFEHQLWSGWAFRYDVGFAHVLAATRWSCQVNRMPAPCDGEAPSDDMMVSLFAVSHTL